MDLNICYVIQSLDWKIDDTAAPWIHMKRVMGGLTQKGHRLTLIKLERNKKVLRTLDFNHFMECSLTSTNSLIFKILESSIRFLQTQFRMPWYQVFDSLRMYDIISQQKDMDILFERNSMHGFATAMASRRLSIPYVLMYDADFLMEHEFLGIHHSRLEKWIAQLTAAYNCHSANVIVCPSEVTRQHIIRSFRLNPDKVKTNPNGADLFEIPKLEEINLKKISLGLPPESPIIMYVGAFYAWHGLDDLIESFSWVVKDNPNSRLVLVGDGETRTALEEKVAACDLTANVFFTGKVDHREVPVLLSMADILVAPYPKQIIPQWQSPMKVFEYMAAAKPIVASDVGQISHVLKDSGIVVSAGDITEFSKAIVRLLHDVDLRTQLGQKAYQKLKTHFTWDQNVNTLEVEIQNAMHNPGERA